MHSEPQHSFQQLEALIQACGEAHAKGQDGDVRRVREALAALTAQMLARQMISAGELAHLHQRMQARTAARC